MACFFALQVEDDEHDVYFLHFAFEELGLSDYLRVVRSGEEAIDYFEGAGPYANREQYPLPVLVLLDLKLPRMNGLEVLRWIRHQEKFRAVIVIIFSSSAHPDDVDKATLLGANAFVQKPSGVEDLIEFVTALKSFWGRFHVFPAAFRDLVHHGSSITKLQPQGHSPK